MDGVGCAEPVVIHLVVADKRRGQGGVAGLRIKVVQGLLGGEEEHVLLLQRNVFPAQPVSLHGVLVLAHGGDRRLLERAQIVLIEPGAPGLTVAALPDCLGGPVVHHALVGQHLLGDQEHAGLAGIRGGGIQHAPADGLIVPAAHDHDIAPLHAGFPFGEGGGAHGQQQDRHQQQGNHFFLHIVLLIMII